MPIVVFSNTSVAPIPSRSQKSMVFDNVQVGGGSDASYITGELVRRSTLSTSTVDSADFGNGDQVINQVAVTNSYNKRLMAIVERAVYVGSVAGANLLPGGSSIDESKYQVIGSNFSVIDTSANTVTDNKLFNHLFIRNISAGAVDLIIHVHVRYILNSGAVS